MNERVLLSPAKPPRDGSRQAQTMKEEVQDALRRTLEALRKRYDRAYLYPDPLELPHRFSDPEDQEIVGLVASSLAYGNVKSIHQSVRVVVSWMSDGGRSPAGFVDRLEPLSALGQFENFRHRWSSGRDVACLLFYAKQMRRLSGSIGDFFRLGHRRGDSIATALTRFSENALALSHGGLYGRKTLPRSAGIRYFFPRPSTGSACKRLNMYLRWMVRPNDGLDFGLWTFVPPSCLVVPLDTHIARIGRRLGWARRRTPDWKMALEITRSLAELDPNDPIKYDFALSRLGILDGCPSHRRTLHCELCELRRRLRIRGRAA